MGTFAWAVGISKVRLIAVYLNVDVAVIFVSTSSSGRIWILESSCRIILHCSHDIGCLRRIIRSFLQYEVSSSYLMIDDYLAKSYIERHHGVYEPEVSRFLFAVKNRFVSEWYGFPTHLWLEGWSSSALPFRILYPGLEPHLHGEFTFLEWSASYYASLILAYGNGCNNCICSRYLRGSGGGSSRVD